jgi:Family of unknown function (DUF6519)
MKGDFTRMTFDPTKHYSRVLEQQGRVQVDSDFNEMNDIHRYISRRLAADLIGPHGGPGDSFKTDAAKDKDNNTVSRDFGIAKGYYYVDGILCENDDPILFSGQMGLPPLGQGELKDGDYLAYLDVWERHLTAYEDENEEKVGILEVALLGPDTATRAQVVWQVKCTTVDPNMFKNLKPDAAYSKFLDVLDGIGEITLGSGKLRARAIKQKANDEPCLISPEARYRGAENQLYRVEIHHGGIAMSSDEGIDKDKAATFKWSRENGSVIFAIADIQGEVVTLRDLGREPRFGLRPDDWVEIVDNDYVLQNRAEPLLRVKEIDRDSMRVTLHKAPTSSVGTDSKKHPLLRRWDQGSKEITVKETQGDQDSSWIFTLEDNVQIQFPGSGGPKAATYRTGDYWLIPARVATGDVDWPGPSSNPQARWPHGVEHHFAPLGIILINGGAVQLGQDLRAKITQLWMA